ncbi:MAG TPA: DEAD/DEAH box helicase [Pseudogracilibacillus sp.]|nr:DEAD/DEAH box helicase [Pseudogracilibacillus sp.]
MNDSLKGINIENIFLPRIYQRGLAYYNEERVEGLSYNRNSQTWFAYVQGTDSYYVDISLEKVNEGKLKSYCECPAFNTYHTCKHVVAVMLAIQNKKEESTVANDLVTTRFIDEMIRLKDRQCSVIFGKVPMNIEYTVHLQDDKVLLEMRTGVDHRYVIQDFREFLDAALNDESYAFTKKFTYYPEEHYFLQKDQHILRRLQAIISTGDVFTRDLYVDTKKRYDRRYLVIPPLVFYDLLVDIQERKSDVYVNGRHYESFQLLKDELPVTYEVTQGKEEQLTLNIQYVSKDMQLFDDYGMLFQDGNFYFPSDAQLNVLKQTMTNKVVYETIPISQDNKDTFFSEVIPTLKKQVNVQIADDVQNVIVEKPLRAKLYIEDEDELIIGKLQYHYGQVEIDPFNGDSHDTIVIRDTEKEMQIMDYIEEANFRYNGKHLYMKLDEDEDVYYFLYTILPELNEHVELYLSPSIQLMMLEDDPLPNAVVQVESNTSLLEIGFDITGVEEDEVNGIIQSVLERKKFYRMKSGAFMSLENEAFDSIKDLFTDLNIKASDMKEQKVQLPAYRAAQVDDVLETRKSYDPSFRKLLSNLKHPEEQYFDLPKGLEADLRHYQLVGYQWFKSLSAYHLGGILADDMGLGKTLQTITYILSEPSELAHLIIVPSSVVYNWKNEFEKFAPHLSVEVIQGHKEDRVKLIEAASEVDVWITSYGTIRQDIGLYEGKSFQTVILDEAQFIKNHTTKTAKAVHQLVATRKYALSGTPIENSLDELWSIFYVVLPGLLPSLKQFRQLDHEHIRMLTKPFILRRVKEDVLTELPEKIESVHVSELSEVEKQLYVGYLNQIRTETSEQLKQGSFQQNRMKILAGLTRLRQLCCHPSLFIENYDGPSSKLKTLLDTIDTFMAEGKRMLIFSQFTSMHDIIRHELEKKGIDYFYLHGQTDAESRVKMSEAFNNGEKSVFLISLRAGGTGLNLTGADTVILYDLWWNPAVEDQAAGRAHRFGQKKVVQVIRLLTEGTIEEKIYELQQKKRELIDRVIQPGETMLSSLSEDDIKMLLNI